MQIHKRRLSILAESNPGLSADEGIMKANGRKIASNIDITKSLFSRNHLMIKDSLPCWTGTMTAYEKPDFAFEKTVEYKDGAKRWVFRIPEDFIGEKNAIAICEHPDFKLEFDGNSRIVHPLKADIVRNFPAENGSYKSDPAYDIPIAEKAEFASEEARYLARTEKRVGLVKRAALYDGNSFAIRKNISLDSRPSQRLGIAVHNEEGDPPVIHFKRTLQEFVVLLEGTDIEDFRRILETAKKELEGIPENQLGAIQKFIKAFRE
ncbi:hypothetical protein JXA56_04695 [Candidatus Micrarchaeota archaeon]|nr:hypothetical protein [Candidatus Micrarchaeota archaeon]